MNSDFREVKMREIIDLTAGEATKPKVNEAQEDADEQTWERGMEEFDLYLETGHELYHEEVRFMSEQELENLFPRPCLASRRITPLRKIAPEYEDKLVQEITYKGETYRPGKLKAVEIYDGYFVGISAIVDRHWTNSSNHEFFISGSKFIRTKEYGGLLPKKINEVALDITTGTAEVSLNKVIKPRLIILTNADFPKFRDTPDNQSQEYISQNCRLVCRWRIVEGRYNGRVERLRADEVHPAYRVEDSSLKLSWRGFLSPVDVDEQCKNLSKKSRTQKEEDFGPIQHYIVKKVDEEGISAKRPFPQVQTMPAPPEKRKRIETIIISDSIEHVDIGDANKYTFGDAFCGGGGASCGARAAGLSNKWAFDRDDTAVETYQRNFPNTKVYKAFVDQFLKLDASEKLVDVLHLSPPCQPHSPAHTVPGQDDEINEASGLCIKPALELARPRVATLEQTFGILNPRRLRWFRAMINDFVLAGYSVRWDILHCVEYGVPQLRRRLILIASCPGEVLPQFPLPTHANPSKKTSSKLKRPRTVSDAIRFIPVGVTHHCPTDKLFQCNEYRMPYTKWDEPFKRTILAGGGDYDVHPDGKRKFTVREIANLQTFPISYSFNGTESQQRRQIGNAVPPRLAEAIFRAIRKAMEDVDFREKHDARL